MEVHGLNPSKRPTILTGFSCSFRQATTFSPHISPQIHELQS